MSICLIALSCTKDKYNVNTYFDKTQQDTLLTNIITYIYRKAPQSSNETKFQPQFRKFYLAVLPKFSIQNYYIAPDSTHYFFVIRPVGNLPYRRGVVGRYKLGKNLRPTDFEEIVNTPHLEEKLVKERGRFLFTEFIRNGNLDKYLPMKHYVEWPDANLIYDKKLNEWVAPTHESIQ
ncbi:hypothetical protein H1R81_18235 [Emticicia sp. BO119]|nr:hypothetical protein [Emticicia sp. BO119]